MKQYQILRTHLLTELENTHDTGKKVYLQSLLIRLCDKMLNSNEQKMADSLKGYISPFLIRHSLKLY